MGNSSSSSTSGGGNDGKIIGKSPLNKRRSFMRFGTRKSKADFSNILSDINQSKDQSFHSAQEGNIWNSSKNDGKTQSNQSRFCFYFEFFFILIFIFCYKFPNF